MTPCIRLARSADLPAVLRLDRAWSPVFARPSSYARLLGDQGMLLVCKEGGAVAGFAAVSRALDEATLLNLVVDPAFRKRGVGAGLLLEVVQRLLALGVRRLLLEVRESQAVARHLYRRCGFGEDGRREAYYPLPGDGREAAILMSRGLASGSAVRA